MKRIFTLLLILTMLTAMAVGCNDKSEPEPSLAGSWVITSFILEDGTVTSIEHELYITFFEGGYGETKSGTETYNAFTFVASNGKLTRTIDYGKGNPEIVEESYVFNDDGTLTIHSPATKNAPAETMTLKRRGMQ
jgi:hypothetical protein